MNLKHINIILAILLIFVIGAVLSSHVDYSQPNLEFLPEMKRSPAWGAYETNPNFRNGRTLQAPVTGTIARGEEPLYFEPVQGEEVPGKEHANPYSVSPVVDLEKTDIQTESNQAAEARRQLDVSTERGTEKFQIFCSSCHGPAGAGDGLVSKRSILRPQSLASGKTVQLEDGQLFYILTTGIRTMPSMASQLSREDRWDVINFLRKLQHDTATSLPDVSSPDQHTSSNEKSDSEEKRP